MKQFLSLTMIMGLAFFLLSSFSIRENPQDPPRGKKTEKHIKMVKVDDDGKKVELDTVITGDEPFVWNGDTIGGGKEMKWISKGDFNMDSLEHYDFEFDGEGNEKVIIRKSGKGGENMIWMHGHPGAPMPTHAPGMMMFRSQNNKNVIDLSDPGIISYDKKIQKDGTEKITIIRKQVNEDSIREEIMIAPSSHSGDVFFYGHSPKHVKTVKVIKGDDGSTQIFEDDKVIEFKGESGSAIFTGDDGEVIHIEEFNVGDEKKVEIKVEKKVEKENK